MCSENAVLCPALADCVALPRGKLLGAYIGFQFLISIINFIKYFLPPLISLPKELLLYQRLYPIPLFIVILTLFTDMQTENMCSPRVYILKYIEFYIKLKLSRLPYCPKLYNHS